jgi:DNA-directed RNA polymerase subunit H (RpoH/RPB5)
MLDSQTNAIIKTCFRLICNRTNDSEYVPSNNGNELITSHISIINNKNNTNVMEIYSDKHHIFLLFNQRISSVTFDELYGYISSIKTHSDDDDDDSIMNRNEIPGSLESVLFVSMEILSQRKKITNQKTASKSGLTLTQNRRFKELEEKFKDNDLNVEWWTANELISDVTEHECVPPHRRYTPGLLNKNIPRLLLTDPVVRYYGWNRDTFVVIYRDSPNCVLEIVYKLVVQG